MCTTNNLTGKGHYGYTSFDLTDPIYPGNTEVGDFATSFTERK
ncbi:hypothetical protein [Mesorhizobium sp. L-8-3]|nr:hypothetical protein [Mesorhizobium sp. L-8-3]